MAPLRPLAGRPLVQAGGGGDGGWGAEPLLRLPPPPRTGCLRPGLAVVGTGWRVQRRLRLQEDILIRLRLWQHRAAAGGRVGLHPAPLPRALAGRETEMVEAETGAPAPGGRERPRPLRALQPLAKVNQTLPRAGGVRRSGRQAGPGGRPGRAGPGGRGPPTLPAPSRAGAGGLPGGGCEAGAGLEAGTQAAGYGPPGRKRRLIRDVFMLICTWLGFLGLRKGVAWKGRSSGEPETSGSTRFPDKRQSGCTAHPLCGLREVPGGRHWASVFSSERKNAGQVSSQARSLRQHGRLALRLLSEDGLETRRRRCEEARCARAQSLQRQSIPGRRSLQEHVFTGLGLPRGQSGDPGKEVDQRPPPD